MSTVVCVFRFPACNATSGKILPICHSICPLVDEILAQCSKGFFVGNSTFANVNRLLGNFECRKPQSYYNFPLQYIASDPNDCSAFSEYIIVD